MAKQIHYLIIATHLPSDSELIFFKTVEEAKAEFKKRTQELFALDGLEEDIDYSIEDEYAVRFNSGENEELSALLEDVNHYFKVGTQDVEDDCEYYVVDFSEYVDEVTITFYNKQNAIIAYNDMVDEALAGNKDVNRYDNTTWEDDDDVIIFSETDNGDGSTDAFFGISDVYWTYRIGKINLTV
jgi:hypothetical protein